MHKLKVLICDDMEHVRNSHEQYLIDIARKTGAFHPVTELSESAEKAIGLTRESIDAGSPFDLCLMDVDFCRGQGPGAMDGFTAVNIIHELSPSTVIVMISAYSTDDNYAMTEERPWVEKFLRRGSFSKNELSEICLYALVRRLHNDGKLLPERDRLYTKSQVMLDYLKNVDRVSADQPVVIFGETGTGKELTAKRLNANAKAAKGQESRPFVTINCGGITESLNTSELFGHVKGAFTGALQDRKGLLEQADGGDVFLDELQNAPIDLQNVIMRVLECGTVTPVGGRPKAINVRFIAAMNRSPSESRTTGTLKPDLLARLQKSYLVIPPLRERPGDIRALVNYFKQRAGGADKTFSPEALAFLECQQWPTNIRGLETVVVDAIRTTKIPVVGVDALKRVPVLKELASESQACSSTAGQSIETEKSLVDPLAAQIATIAGHWVQADGSLIDAVRLFERAALLRLWKADPTPARIAKRAKMPESTIRRKLIEYAICQSS
jgi:DNA-binding NtrC family response regulator